MMRLRFGGSISGSTLSGGTSVESAAIGITDWGGLWGHPGFRGVNPTLLSQDGSQFRRKPYGPRIMTLSVAVWNRDAQGTITAPDGACEELDLNRDTLLTLVDGDGGQFIIEDEQTDGDIRWIRAAVSGPANFIQGPLFGGKHAAYTLLLPLMAAYPFWQSETLHDETVTTSLVNAGNGRIGNAVITLGGSASIANDEGDELVNLDGTAIVVDVGARTVTQGGNPADNLLDVATGFWMRFGRGTTTLTTAGTVDVEFRDHWL